MHPCVCVSVCVYFSSWLFFSLSASNSDFCFFSNLYVWAHTWTLEGILPWLAYVLYLLNLASSMAYADRLGALTPTLTVTLAGSSPLHKQYTHGNLSLSLSLSPSVCVWAGVRLVAGTGSHC